MIEPMPNITLNVQIKIKNVNQNFNFLWASLNLYSVLISVEIENSKVNIADANKRTSLNWFYLHNDKSINNTENKHN